MERPAAAAAVQMKCRRVTCLLQTPSFYRLIIQCRRVIKLPVHRLLYCEWHSKQRGAAAETRRTVRDRHPRVWPRARPAGRRIRSRPGKAPRSAAGHPLPALEKLRSFRRTMLSEDVDVSRGPQHRCFVREPGAPEKHGLRESGRDRADRAERGSRAGHRSASGRSSNSGSSSGSSNRWTGRS